MIRKIIAGIILFGTTLNMTAQIERPKLVVGITVDQMRWDYLYYYYNQFGEGGLKRLINEGFSCENTMVNYIPTVTAIGHSSIYTGSIPALTGIAGNNFMINGKSTYCTQDDQVQSVGSNDKDGQMSPHNLLASGIGTVMKIATDYKAKVIGIALKDRAAILPAGHGADAAYWWDTPAGHFISSTYYMKELPKWVKRFNKDNQQAPGKDVKGSIEGVTMTFKMAEAAVENEQLGQDSIPDLLALSISSTDYIGHTYGTRGQQNHDVYMQLDKDLAHFLSFLDKKVGKGNYLIWLSADHGAIHNYNLMNKHNIAAGAYAAWNECKQFNEKFQPKHGFNAISMVNADRIYLNHNAIDSAKIDLQDVKKDIITFLKKNNSRVYRVIDYENIMNTTLPEPIRERIINSYNPDRSGDLYIITIPGTVDAKPDPKYIGTEHGVWNPYDSHIPLIFMGWHIKKGQTSTPIRIVDIAPTICELLHIQMPSACIGNAINEVIHP